MKKIFSIFLFISFNNFSFAQSGKEFFNQSVDALIQKDYAQAVKLAKKACNAGVSKGCYNLGVSYYKGKGVEQDYQKASQLFEKACNAGDAFGCNNLGFLYVNGQGVKLDYQEASKLFKKACNLGDQDACDNYKVLNSKGK